jgi:ribosome-binding factor A
MAGVIRQNRVAESIRRFVSTLVLSDFGGTPADSITISHVSVSQDLRSAKIFYSVFGEKDIREIQDFLESSTKNVRFKLAAHIRNLKMMPEIRFVYDDSVEKMIRLEKLFDELKHEDQEN